MTPATLFPVVERSWFDGPCPYPWPAADDWQAFEHRGLTVGMTDAEIGSVAACLAIESGIDPGPDVVATLAALATADYLSLRGGMAVTSGDKRIAPSCCTSLGEWREWVRGLRDGSSPWMGHDPFAWVEWGEATVRVWSDGRYNPAPEAFAIDFPRDEVAAQLDRVTADLRAFAIRLAGWAAGRGLTDAGRLAERFMVWFGPDAPPELPDPPDDPGPD